jgi:hypothetical protein
MSFTSWLRNIRSALAPDGTVRRHRPQRPGRGRAIRRLVLEPLEDRSLPSCMVSLAPDGMTIIGDFRR